ncbi:MAG TPA: hypothetical protein VH374_00205 [Polyangia bacterium]|jgi:hypothetical protein|nr:hypothetical protein [Polyangia bacterium]
MKNKTTKSNTFSGILFATVAAALATGASGCALSVEADVPEIEVTKKDIAFAGVPIGAALGDVSMTKSFSQKHTALELPQGLTTEVHAIGVTLTAKSGVTDFSFIHMLRLTMADENNQATSVELINYEQPTNAAPSATLTMVSANPANALKEWMSDSAIFTIDVAGTLPTGDWSADVTMKFGGSIKYSR